jgi:hypothetical protein
MMALALFAEAAAADPAPLTAPDPSAMQEAVKACDRDAMGKLNKVEPHRRAEFAGAVYAEQVAIARARADLDATAPTSASGRASLETARVSLDSRQKRLDDMKLVEKAWREAVEEMRADYLGNCDLHRRG